MADGLCASREEAMTAFRMAFDRVPDNTIDKVGARHQQIVYQAHTNGWPD